MNPEMFFYTPIEAFLTFAAISFGLGLILVWREITNARVIREMRAEMRPLNARIDTLQNIVNRHFPIEGMGNMSVNIDRMDGSTVLTAGRDGRMK